MRVFQRPGPLAWRPGRRSPALCNNPRRGRLQGKCRNRNCKNGWGSGGFNLHQRRWGNLLGLRGRQTIALWTSHCLNGRSHCLGTALTLDITQVLRRVIRAQGLSPLCNGQLLALTLRWRDFRTRSAQAWPCWFWIALGGLCLFRRFCGVNWAFMLDHKGRHWSAIGGQIRVFGRTRWDVLFRLFSPRISVRSKHQPADLDRGGPCRNGGAFKLFVHAGLRREGRLRLIGWGGHLRLIGRDGALRIAGGDGTLRIVGRNGHLRHIGRDGRLCLIGRDGALHIVGRNGHLRHIGRDGRLSFIGRDGRLCLIGRDGTLRIAGRDGTLRIVGRDGGLRLIERDGRLCLIGRDGHLRLIGRNGALHIVGRDGGLSFIGRDGGPLSVRRYYGDCARRNRAALIWTIHGSGGNHVVIACHRSR